MAPARRNLDDVMQATGRYVQKRPADWIIEQCAHVVSDISLGRRRVDRRPPPAR